MVTSKSHPNGRFLGSQIVWSNDSFQRMVQVANQLLPVTSETYYIKKFNNDWIDNASKWTILSLKCISPKLIEGQINKSIGIHSINYVTYKLTICLCVAIFL